jgi:hypothetical protein
MSIRPGWRLRGAGTPSGPESSARALLREGSRRHVPGCSGTGRAAYSAVSTGFLGGVGLRRLLLVGAVASIVLAGCGGDSDKTSTAATKAPTTAAPNANTVNTSTSSLPTHVLTRGELPGFRGSRPSVYNTVSGWLEEQNSVTQVAASQTKPLTRLGFVAAATENLSGPSGHAGLSLVEQFKTPGGARSELANERKMFKATVPGYKPFPVPGIPGAFGYAAEGPGLNLAFASGDYYYLVGEFVSAANTRSEATLITAAKSLLRRAHG